MPIIALLATTLGAEILTLDARPELSRCVRSQEDVVTVCAPSTLPTTRLPIEVNGRAGTVLVEPSGPDYLECNGSYAAQAGIDQRQPTFTARVGSIDLRMYAAEPPVSLLGRKKRRAVIWSRNAVVAGADCIVGPRQLGYQQVRFVLGPAQPGSTILSLPFFPDRKDDRSRVYADVRVGGEKVGVRFELGFKSSVLTAPAVQVLAPILGITAIGPTVPMSILYGVARPVRALRLNWPLRIGTIMVRHPFGRILDYANVSDISAVDPAEADADDIVVAGKRPPPGATRLIRVGKDDLSVCSLIEVDVVRRRFNLQC